MKNNNPRITILMPVYNVEKYVQEAIESILKQTYKAFKLLILDDCSTDNTAKIVKGFNDERIHYVRQEKNLGLADNLNVGIELADTEYLARMDGDDISVATCLEKQINYLDSHPETGVCGVGLKFFGARDATLFFPEKNDDIRVEQLFGNAVIQPMFRRSIFIENNLRYKTSAFPAEDYRMWSECMNYTKIYNLQEVLFHYRTHAAQISTEKKEEQIRKSNEVRLYLLDNLYPELLKEQKLFFLNSFIPCKVSNKNDLQAIIDFADLLESENKKNKKLNSKSLHNRLYKHITLAVYYSVLEKYFNKKYSVSNYVHYISSGLYRWMPSKYNIRILIKSILHKKV